jgi:acetoin utilization deacetylase AcuC-like enzyme
VITVYSDAHEAHWGKTEFFMGRVVPCLETPQRAEAVLEAIRGANLGPVVTPEPLGETLLARVHTQPYLTFLQTIYAQWAAEHGEIDAFPYVFRRAGAAAHATAVARLGEFATDVCSPITRGSWIAAKGSAEIATSGAALVCGGQRTVFALCRPPGHHAGRNFYGGYCFLNNGAIAAERFLSAGAGRVAILDIDNHHGNGTQDIFYDRADVLCISIHGTPQIQFPWFSGTSEETGTGAGEGFNLNLPLRAGAGMEQYGEALEHALQRISRYNPETLIVALGVDAWQGDPTSQLGISTDDFRTIGARIARLGLPTLFVMEGGYALDSIGRNVCATLTGHLDAAGA